jgi:hypothetical protein
VKHLLLLWFLAAPLAAQDRPVLRAAPLTGTIRLDGRLDEAAWSAADSITALTQVEPREGERPTGRTVLRILASVDELIIGVRADDPDAAAITAFSRQRDADLDSEDHIRLVFDTFLDGRSGYVFTVGAAGARYDALITNQGEDENSNWDAAWEAKVSRTSTGWSAEIRLPVKSLIFRPGSDAWGFNVERRIQRLLETSRWSGARRDWELGQTSRAGLLEALPPFDVGLGLTVRPSLTTGIQNSADADPEGVFHPSLDVTKRLGANLLGALTVNTDFAETEVDSRRTNLTRFPLFFPEKREFFLDGADIFDFGLSAAADVIPFFSRRIGLFEGEEVPLLAGAKVSGRAGNTNLGALITRTGSDDDAGVSGETMGAVRLKQNILTESSVGGILTFGDPAGNANAWTAGADFTYQTSRLGGDKNFLVGAWAVATDHEGLEGKRGAAGFKIDYPNDDWDAVLIYKWIGDGFQPSLGFAPRPGVQQIRTGATRRIRPAGGPINDASFGLHARLVTGLEWERESWSLEASPVNLVFRTGDEISFSVTPQGEQLEEPFEVDDGIVIEPGDYGFVRAELDLETASKRALGGELQYSFGGFYDGTLHTVQATLLVRPVPTVVFTLEGELNRGRMPQGDFNADLVAARIRFGLSPDLDLSSFVQYDTESRNLGTNTRFRWSFHPLGDLFVVYNHNIDRGADAWLFASNELLVKVKYGFRY